MRIDAFDYAVTPGSIAQYPATERELARLLVVPPSHDGSFQHLRIRNLPDLLPPGSLLVLNDTRVLPARLFGEKVGTGGKVEIFLLRPLQPSTPEASDDRPSGSAGASAGGGELWEALGRSSKPFRVGSEISVPPLTIRVVARGDDGHLRVEVRAPEGSDVRQVLRTVGHMPLPPYIKREDIDVDRERYQTVFARQEGAVAAPTAGLHLTQGLLERLRARGCEVAYVTLHVGLGTFQPVTVEDLDDHPMHAEMFEVPESTANAIKRARARNACVIAVGTTVVRALESAAAQSAEGGRGFVDAVAGETRLLIQPGFTFRVTDMLLTNFHLPRSTLLAMVCAFAGRERVLDAYVQAVLNGYRFFSYGDAMLLSKEARDSRDGATPGEHS